MAPGIQIFLCGAWYLRPAGVHCQASDLPDPRQQGGWRHHLGGHQGAAESLNAQRLRLHHGQKAHSILTDYFHYLTQQFPGTL